jgi:hypothetical protein
VCLILLYSNLFHFSQLSLDNKIIEVEKLVREKIQHLPELRLFLITHNQWLRVYNSYIEKYTQFAELAFTRGLNPERGNILDFFSKLEFLVNELIHARILGLFSDRAYEFDQILEYVDLSHRITLLKKWRMINNNEQDKITKILSSRSTSGMKKK